MKTAVAYIRISTKDQSNFSIPGQQQFIRDYCDRKNISLVTEFIDNGQSAKNFDRADWKKLETFVRKNYKTIDYLIVVKYDRFSRNVAEGLNMIEKLEKNYSISVLSVFEEIAIDPASPFFFKMRTDMLVQAEFELRVIRDRTKFGVKQAKKEGRWLTLAPFGYVNRRDDKNKPIIVIEPDQAKVVKEMFDMWIEGAPIKRIHDHAKDLGFKHKSKSAVPRILQNPVYAGFVEHEGQTYKGLQEPIVSLETFNEAQSLFKNEKAVKVQLNPDVPLKGVLRCECGKYLTAGKSKGKIHYYWYYKCSAHLQFNYNAKVVHDKLRELLYGLSLSQDHLNEIKAAYTKKLTQAVKEGEKGRPKIKKAIEELESKISSLEEKFIGNKIDFDIYSKWNTLYNKDLNSLKEQLKVKNTTDASIWKKYEQVTKHLTNLYFIFEKCTVEEKQSLLNLVFNRSLKYQLNTFMYDKILPEFAVNAASLNEKSPLLLRSSERLNDTISTKSTISTRDGT